MSESFYRAFEDRHRGTRELIKDRLKAYLPFLIPLQNLHTELPALDIGCGRGEWLELLLELGFQPLGVDLDEGMLEACTSQGLPASKGDALTTLQSLPTASMVLVSGFHVAEHIPFDQLQQITAEALRVLRPGGLLILETPNAENLAVGSHYFYMDPTHERPIPHLLLDFLMEHSGFARTKLLRLQEPEALRNTSQVSLINVISGSSPDYAIVAQKAAPEGDLAVFNSAFEQEYGLSIDTLAQRYDDHFNGALQSLTQRMDTTDQMFQRLDQTLSRIGDLPSLLDTVAQNRHLEAQLHDAGSQLAAALANAEHWYARTMALENSTSWQLTRPLRAGRRALSSPLQIVKNSLRRLLAPLMRLVLGRPGLRRHLNQQLRRHPRLHDRLKQFAQNRGLVASATGTTSTRGPKEQAAADLNTLSPRARTLYQQLKKAIREKGND